jgi:hypothetical protein
MDNITPEQRRHFKRRRISLQALADQGWAGLAEYKDDINRIADNGPENDRDALIIRKCMYLIAAELDTREADVIMTEIDQDI